MKHVLFLLILLCPQYSFAQNLNGSVKWVYNQTVIGPPEDPYFIVIQKTKDTIVQDRNAALLHGILIHRVDSQNRNDTLGMTWDWIVSYEGDQFFLFNQEQDSFYLRHDFSLNQGDTLHTLFENVPLKMKVDSVSSISFYGEERKVQYLSSTPDPGIVDKVIEGIGSLAWMELQSPVADPPDGGKLVCFNQNDNIYPEDDAYCEIIASLGKTIVQDASFLTPNPTTGLLQIDDEPIEDVRIFNINGKLMLSQHRVSSPLDISHMPEGVYFISYSIQDTPHIQKIVKLN